MNLNWQIVKGHAKQLAGVILEGLGRLTHNDLRRLNGHQLVILGKMQVIYGQVVHLATRNGSPASPASAVVVLPR